MDPMTLAAATTAVLTPFLAKAGEVVLEDAARAFPGAVGQLWLKLAERFRGKPAAEGAARDLLNEGADQENQEAFKVQLRKILKKDPLFSRELESLLRAAQADINIRVHGTGAAAADGSVAAGEGGIAVKGNVEGNIIVGNNNVVHGGRKKH